MSSDPGAGAPFWHACWANGGAAFSNGERGHLLAAHWPALCVAPGSSVLVPLAGKSHDMAWLASHGYDVVGVELSPVACAAFFAEHQIAVERSAAGPFGQWQGGGVTLLEGDFFDFDGHCTAALDRGALVAMPGAERPRYARHLRGRLEPGGVLLLVSIEYDPARRSGPPFPVFADDVRALFPAAVEQARQPLRGPRWHAVGGADAVVWVVRL
jgi:thiopurine S-methyltransferase